MRQRRGADEQRELCSGPGRLAQALGIDKALDGLPLDAPRFQLRLSDEPASVTTGQESASHGLWITRGVLQ